MGTTLTGTTPQDTYDSLIKVTDNGPLSGTLKALSDGLGNDSTLSLSTTAASIAGTLAVAGNATFDTSTLVVDATNNRVGIGTATPTAGYSLSVVGAFAAAKGGAYVEVGEFDRSLMILNHTNASVNANLFQVQKSGTGVFTLTSAGNVGIGTSEPAGNLHIASASDTGIRIQGSASGLSYIDLADTASGTPAGSIAYNHISNAIVFATDTNVERARITSNGLSFNGDTAAANALDDYEEGTWTMGVAFGGASVGVVYTNNTGTYTKIGRQVTVNGFVRLTNKGSSTGSAVITGLPFTIANTNGNYSSPSLTFNDITFTNQFQGESQIGATNILLQETTILGTLTSLTDADFANTSYILLSFTYFV